MMREGIDFLDANYENVSLGKKPRQIRTKSTSFSQIKKYFTDFRIRLLSKKLEREKDKAVTEAYPERFSEKDEERMMKRAATIARLEQKIKILDGENVPVDYIDKRAIKIKKAMMKNISYTSGNIYTVGLENKEAVFNATAEPEVVKMDPEVQESIAADVKRIMEEEKKEAEAVQEEVAAYTPSPVTKAEIRAEIDEEFAKLAGKAKKAKVQETAAEPHINLDEIKASIDEAFQAVKEQKEVPQATIGTDAVKDVVEESFESVNVDSKISREDIKAEVDEAMGRVVSKNGATSAKVDRFNEDGSRREKYNYTPMTDEEIRAAQENIEYDKYEQIYKDEHAKAKAHEEAQPVVEEAPYVYTPMTDEEIKAAQENIEYDKYEQIYKDEHARAKAEKEAQPVVEEEPYVYTPMTDEEIKAAQANIEYDKYEEVYRAQNEVKFKTAEFKDIFKPADPNGFNVEEEAVRDIPVIVPEVDGARFVSKPHIVEERKQSVVSKPTSIEEFGALKAKVEELKKKLAETESKKNTAVQFAERTSSRAEEIKRITIDSERAYQDRIASLQLLAQTLEENCKLNETAAHAATKDAECNERFISSQMAKKEQFDDAINQVDSFLSFTYGEEEERGPRRRAA